ncbi:hypothetical protein D3C86_1673320 [compost metagenome]
MRGVEDLVRELVADEDEVAREHPAREADGREQRRIGRHERGAEARVRLVREEAFELLLGEARVAVGVRLGEVRVAEQGGGPFAKGAVACEPQARVKVLGRLLGLRQPGRNRRGAAANEQRNRHGSGGDAAGARWGAWSETHEGLLDLTRTPLVFGAPIGRLSYCVAKSWLRGCRSHR